MPERESRSSGRVPDCAGDEENEEAVENGGSRDWGKRVKKYAPPEETARLSPVCVLEEHINGRDMIKPAGDKAPAGPAVRAY